MAQQQQESLVQLATLSVEQLAQLKQVFEEDLKSLEQALQQLRFAKDRFATSKNCVEVLQGAKSGDSVLVPITSSLYVPGKLNDPNKLLVDIGTGFFVQKDSKQTQEYMVRRLNDLSANIAQIQEKFVGKRKDYELIVEYLQRKMAFMQKQQQ